jgi:hypothetical protein
VRPSPGAALRNAASNETESRTIRVGRQVIRCPEAAEPASATPLPEIPMRKTAVFFVLCTGLLSLALVQAQPAAAAWPTDPLVNVPLCTAAGDQLWPASVPDGAGGMIVAWTDLRAGADYSYSDLYVQRISAAGVLQWAPNGVPLCTASGSQADAALGILSDGVGGAIVTWSDFRSGVSYHIYAQRISAAGTPQWTADGVAVCSAGGGQQSPTITADGAGGAIIAWFDSRNGNYDIYAQRLSGAGAPVWADDGVALCTATGFQEYPTLVSDGASGAIVTWFDQRTGPSYTYSDIYAQRVSSAGTPQWTADGVALCTTTGADQFPTLASDGAGGAFVTWFSARSGNYDIYAQRVSGAGTPLWTADGVALCVASGEQAYPSIIPDGIGGAIVGWRDYRNGFDYNTYSQRISATGAPEWTPNGVPLCTADGDQYEPVLAPDGAGGVVASWADYRDGTGSIFAQRTSALGATQWTADGVAVCTAGGNQNVPSIVSDGLGGAIVAWHDNRSAASYDIYAQRVKANGQLGGDVASVPVAAPLAFALDAVSPNPARGGALTIRFTLPVGAAASLELLDVAGRRVALREVGSFGAGSHSLRLGEGQLVAPGLYLVRLRQGTNSRVVRVAVLR